MEQKIHPREFWDRQFEINNTFIGQGKSEMLKLFYDILIPGKTVFTHENNTLVVQTLAQVT